MIVVLMGVAGSGKTTVGQALAARMGWQFLDADDVHPPENIARMRAGVPLTDEQREPWLSALRARLLNADAAGRDVVVACSALRRTFRERLSEGVRAIRFVHLHADRDVIAQRLSTRADHFAGPALLDSQFETLEEPEGAVEIDASEDVRSIVERIRRVLSEIDRTSK
jgi:gluconokinase